MDEIFKKKTSKIYCERCDDIFTSRRQFEKHLDCVHSSNGSYESCPIDTVFSKIAGFFKKNKKFDLE